jgi:hypothetical protein
LVRRAFPEELRAAELNELDLVNHMELHSPSEEEKLLKELDDTRYDDF